MREIDDEDGTADYLKKPPGTLRQWRHQRHGPPYLKLGRGVRYRKVDVDEWLEAQRVNAR